MLAKRSFRLNLSLSVSIVSMNNEVFEIENLNILQLGGLVSKKYSYLTSCIEQCTELSQFRNHGLEFPELFISMKAWDESWVGHPLWISTISTRKQRLLTTNKQSFHFSHSSLKIHTPYQWSLIPPTPILGFRRRRRVGDSLTKFWTVQRIFADYRPLY